jgi:hypothetical protein
VSLDIPSQTAFFSPTFSHNAITINPTTDLPTSIYHGVRFLVASSGWLLREKTVAVRIKTPDLAKQYIMYQNIPSFGLSLPSSLSLVNFLSTRAFSAPLFALLLPETALLVLALTD